MPRGAASARLRGCYGSAVIPSCAVVQSRSPGAARAAGGKLVRADVPLRLRVRLSVRAEPYQTRQSSLHIRTVFEHTIVYLPRSDRRGASGVHPVRSSFVLSAQSGADTGGVGRRDVLLRRFDRRDDTALALSAEKRSELPGCRGSDYHYGAHGAGLRPLGELHER